jgi:hypothetical protein
MALVAARELRALLGATWFAADLSPEAGRRLATLGRLADIAEGTTVAREGAPYDSSRGRRARNEFKRGGMAPRSSTALSRATSYPSTGPGPAIGFRLGSSRTW